MDLSSLLQTEIFGRSVGNIAYFLGSVLLAALVAKLMYWIFRYQLGKLAAKTETEIDDILVKVWEKPVIILSVLIITYFSIDYLKLEAGVLAHVQTIYAIVMTMVMTVGIAASYEKVLDYILTPIAEKTESKLDDQLFPILIRGGKFLILVMGLLIALSNAGYNIYSLVAGLGVGGIAIAMAARETIGHVFGGVSIFADKPFVIGDYIIVDPEKYSWWGKVTKIGLRSTRIKSKYETTLVIPNSILGNTVVENISAFGERRRYSESLFLELKTSAAQIQEVITMIDGVLAATDGVEEGEVHFYQTTLFAHRLRLRFWVNPFLDYHDRIQEVNLKIMAGFEAAGIALAKADGSLKV